MRKRILFIFLLVLCLCAVPVSAAALGKVSGVKAKQSGEKVKVTWNTAAGAKGYQVYQKTGSEKDYSTRKDQVNEIKMLSNQKIKLEE